MRSGTRIRNKMRTPHPGGNADVHQMKEVAGKAIRKTMKTKGRQTTVVGARWYRDRAVERELRVDD